MKLNVTLDFFLKKSTKGDSVNKMGLQKARRLAAFCQNQALPPFRSPKSASTLQHNDFLGG